MTLNIKIPAKHYVGFKKGPAPMLGFMTPWGEDKAAEKRMETVDRWSGAGYKKKPPVTPKIYDNKPLGGYKITESINRWYNSNKVWRILDPRGFELEISSGNMAALIDEGTIEKGIIKKECIWARRGPDNVLLYVDTNEYRQAIENTHRTEKKRISLKSIEIGDHVVFKNGQEGIYAGYHFGINKRYQQDDGVFQISEKKKHYFIGADKKSIPVPASSPNIVEIKSKRSIGGMQTNADGEAQINKICEKKKEWLLGVTSTRFIKDMSWKLELKKISLKEAKKRGFSYRDHHYIWKNNQFGLAPYYREDMPHIIPAMTVINMMKLCKDRVYEYTMVRPEVDINNRYRYTRGPHKVKKEIQFDWKKDEIYRMQLTYESPKTEKEYVVSL